MIRALLFKNGWRRRLAKAIRWRIHAEDGVLIEEYNELRSWLGKSDNRFAYDHVTRVWDLLDTYKETPELLSIRRDALRRTHSWARASEPLGIKLAVAALCCLAILGVSLIALKPISPNKPVLYMTGIGEHRVVTLPDGSRITMDSSTTVRQTRFSGQARSFALVNGRARFDVAHDLSRPFTVAAGAQTVIAVGTAFSVERLSAKTLVTLDEGLVVVRNGNPSDKQAQRSIWLAPGQELVATQAGNVAVSKVDLESADAWRRGQIVLTDEPLDETVEQVNRYLTVPIKVDPAVAKMRVSGVFNVGNLDILISSLTDYFPLKSRLQDGHVLLERRD